MNGRSFPVDPSGRWRLKRLVADGVARRLVRGHGLLDVASSGPGEWRLVENLDFDGYEARRESFWRIKGGSLIVCYPDGTPFVTLDLREERAMNVHLCAPDRYLARFRPDFPDRFSLAWRVSGPRKDYAMVTDYRRSG